MMTNDDYQHFVCIVAGENPEKLMEPYDNTKVVEPYVKYYYKDAGKLKEKFIEFCKFILGRAFTMLIEYFGGMLLFKFCPIPEIISKCIITVVVIILNFFISKFFAFKEKK